MVSGDKRNWKIELGMFLLVLILTTIFLVIYVIVEIYWSWIVFCRSHSYKNKLAKARKMRKPPGMLSLKKFGPGKIWVENVWTQNTCILGFLHTFILISENPTKTQIIFINFLTELGGFKNIDFFSQIFWVNIFLGSTKFFGS